MKLRLFAAFAALALCMTTARSQMTPWLLWTLLPDTVMNEIVGEASGENAWHMIMETGGYDKDRLAPEYETMFHETRFYLDKLAEYGLTGVRLDRYPGDTTWDAVKGELWEVSPMRQKLASYVDMAAMLASGSTSCDVEGELVWVGDGRAESMKGKDLRGKIVVTEGYLGGVHRAACLDSGAAGVISVSGTRPYFDPIQIGWGSIGGDDKRGLKARFAFQIPPRDGDYLKRRLLAGEKITARAKVVTERRKYDLQNITWSIPGTDTTSGEVIFSAHLFEGYVKQGGNDDISGCASITEIARTLNTLISEGRIPPPKRTIRFLMGPEFSGTGPWVKAHRELMAKTLCDINLDMVGEWLSKNKSFMCLMRTSYGNPHYVNDVVENYYRFVGEGNRERIQNRSGAYAVQRRIVAPTGADEPFYYSIETHYGASDHEVFNDWAVGVPGVMMIAWPDQWYHTSGDHVDKSDPTQLKRVAIIGAASAYTIACAEGDMAVRIAGEVLANASARLSHQYMRGVQELNAATGDSSLSRAYKAARTYIEAAQANERSTLGTVAQLSSDGRVAGYIAGAQASVDRMAALHLEDLRTHMKSTAQRLNIPPAEIKVTDLERRAQKVVPRPTSKVKENGYAGYREYINKVPKEVRDKYPYEYRSIGNPGELTLLINGKNSVLDIKKLLDAQQSTVSELQAIFNYLEILRSAGLVDM
jgi:aminopeptidase YwaD